MSRGDQPFSSEDIIMRNPFVASSRFVVLAAVAFALVPKAILAVGYAPIRGTFTVSYMRPSVENYCGVDADPTKNLSIEAQGIGSITGFGPLFITVKKCFTFSTSLYAGTFMLSSGNGDTISGTYAGVQSAGDPNGFGPFQGTLTINASTGKFRHTTSGELTFKAVASPPSTSATAGAVNGNAYYLVRGNMASDKDKD
jgi:hypothetical protein